MRKKSGDIFVSKKAIVLAIAATTIAGSANAIKIEVGDDWDLNFDNSLQYQLGVRARSMDPQIGNGPFFAEGDYKFPKSGDIVTDRISDLVEFQGIYKKDFGFRTSASGWKDFAYSDQVKDNPVFQGFGLNTYTNSTYNDYTKHYYEQGGMLLDAFVFGKADAGDIPVYAKAGRLTQYWGNAFFFAFSNIGYSQSPINFQKAFAQPGSEVKELFLPRSQVVLSADITPEVSVTGEYFFQYAPNLYPEAGTYLGFFDVLFNGPTGPTNASILGFPAGNMGQVNPPNSDGNFGLKLSWSPKWIGGDLGFYYRVLDEVDPWPLLTFGNPGFPSGGAAIQDVYARKVKLYGLSFEKSFGEISTGWEISNRRHTELNSAFVAGPNDRGASGSITNVIGNTLIQLGGSPLWDTGVLLAEFSYTHLNSVQDNLAQYNGVGTSNCSLNGTPAAGTWRDGCSTNNSLAIAFLFDPQWLQALPGIDFDVPISYTYGVHGNPAYRASAFYAQDTNIYSLGVKALYHQKTSVELSYNGYHWATNGTAQGPAGPYYAGFGGNGPVAVNDRGWIALTVKTSF